MEWFEDDAFWVGFSGALFADSRLADAAKLVATSDLFKVADGAAVLDLGCGPGTHAVPLAARGARVTGVDLSEAMLARARRAAEEASVEVRLVRADMRHFVEPGAFDLVVSMYTSFGYFADPDENLAVLRNARACLAPGGRLLLDLFPKEAFARWAGTPKVVDLAEGTLFMRDTILDDWARFRSDWTLVVGDDVRRGHFVQHVYSAVEAKALLAAAGFTDVECFGGFDRSPYDHRAERLVLRAARPA
jgi:SAM-dependent methyltransferase